MRQETLADSKVNTRLLNKKWIRIAVQALLVIGFSIITAIAKQVAPTLGIPSSSAPFCYLQWLSPVAQ